jgi:hypothetical protein
MCVCFDDGVMDRFYEESSDCMKFRIAMPDQGGRSGIEGALRWSGKDRVPAGGGAPLLHVQMAMMRSAATAAGREVRLCVRRKREYRRDQREAEEQQERDCQEAAHTVIVADEQMRFTKAKRCKEHRYYLDEEGMARILAQTTRPAVLTSKEE